MGNVFAFLLKHKASIASIAAGIGLLVSASQVYDWVYSKGVNDTIVKIQSEQVLLDEERRKQTELEIKKSLDLQKQFYEERLVSLMKEKEVEVQVKEVIRYVNKEIVIPSDCTEFSNSVVSVLKQANDITIRAAETGSTEAKDNGGSP